MIRSKIPDLEETDKNNKYFASIYRIFKIRAFCEVVFIRMMLISFHFKVFKEVVTYYRMDF